MEQERRRQQPQPLIMAMTAGAAAGMTEHAVMFPVDTIKTRLQAVGVADVRRPTSVVQALQQVRENGGPRLLYRGLSAVLCAAIPSHAAHFGMYEFAKRQIGEDSLEHQPVATALSGMLATMAHDAVATPLDVVKQRMQLFGGSAWNTAVSLYRKEGLSVFLRSYPTTVAVNLPFMAAQFVTYESVKLQLLRRQHDAEWKTWHTVVAGGFAGAVGGLASTPLDFLKTQIQLSQVRAANPIDAFLTCVRMHGTRALFTGASARMLYHAPSAALCWTTYETVKRLLGWDMQIDEDDLLGH
ncbi:MAG: hypothetical protein MHM6MM_003039 [Cercozoa sp. M6MM]